MPKIAALGPRSTFTELAAQHYALKLGDGSTIELFPTFGKVFSAVGGVCDLGILPIENMTEGYVPVVLDLLVKSDLAIIDEFLVPVQFSLVANCAALEEIQRVYAQFVTQGQCERLLDALGDVQIVATGSNGASLEQALKGIPGEAAIVPSHSARPGDFALVREQVADHANNVTRFIVLSRVFAGPAASMPCKTSILIFESVDRPGILSGILNAFGNRGINLLSIMSRPTKEMLGRYHFFIDIEGHRDDPNVRDAFEEIGQVNTVKILGSYPAARAPLVISGGAPLLRDPDDVLPRKLSVSPFAAPAVRPSVFVASGDDPYRTARAALASIDLSAARGKRVLLKPNAGRAAAPGSGIVTHPAVVAAAIDAFREAGAEVSIGESPVAGVDTMRAFDASGIAAVARERACPLIDMDKRRYVSREIPDGVAIDSIKVCPEALEFDLVVSMPVMKTHMHTGVTLAVKNMKGCLWRRSKVDLHMLPGIPGVADRPLNVAIADMSTILRPHLSIIDGTVGMEGLGPSAGSAKKLGVVVVSADAFAADAVACRLMGINAHDVPHLRLGAERCRARIDLADIDVSPRGWERHAQNFAPPPENLSIEFPGVKILDVQSCSACQSTLLLFLKRYGNDLRLDKEGLSVAIGRGHDSVPPGTLCVGNCTARYKKMGIHVTGCPPVASEILRVCTQNKGAEFRPHD